MWLIKKLGSIYFTVILSVVLMVLLIISTTMESLYGTYFAQKVFYQATWFDLFLSLLWVNIFAATILRFPFKKYHIGFLITHIGILGLLLGALCTRLYGIEGRMILFEGETSNRMVQGEGYQLQVSFPDKESEIFNLKPGAYNLAVSKARFEKEEHFCEVAPGGNDSHGAKSAHGGKKEKKERKFGRQPLENLEFSINKVFEHAVEDHVIKAGGSEAPKNYAVRINLKSPQMRMDESLWLIEKHPHNPHANMINAGPVAIALEMMKQDESDEPVVVKTPVLRILNKAGEELAVINLEEKLAEEILLKNSGLRIVGLKYYPYAKVIDNKLTNVSSPGDSPNPAVEYNIADATGNSEHYIRFALFPDFAAMHGQASEHGFDDLKVKIEVPEGHASAVLDGQSLTFFVSQEGKWTFRSKLKDGTLFGEGQVALNKWTPVGLGDMQFSVEKLLSDAVVSEKIINSPNDEGVLAVEVSVDDGARTQWIGQGQEKEFNTEKGDVRIAVVPISMQLPFSITLKDFRKIDYPGTRRPAAFESDVTMHDEEERITITKTISMNNPLDHKGFRVFQSSYVQDPNYGEASIFMIAKNPGIFLIYLSSCIIFIGAMFQFYGKPSKNKK